ncbi:hypothetical protein AVEN_99380-1 [Araneus ventricosus]|uniref:Uncharacterized protein n=1 Tax=Araneus ventricosus TaxID=182803 RepID=A0A4Y2GRQ5_ARAVE|nr:hypothetical protein AVEN_99380-1 [Araneus ventricosus]
MTPSVLPFVPPTSYFERLMTLLSFPIRSIYLLLRMPNPYAKALKVFSELEHLRKLLARVKTDEDSDFDNEDNGPGDVLEEHFSDHENFSEHDTESEEDRRHCFFSYQ